MEQLKTDNPTNLIKSVLSTEVRFVIGVITIALGVVRPYYAMKEDLALIQKDISVINSNHEVHIQDINQNIKEIKQAEINQNAQIIELQKQILIISSKK